MTKPDQKTLTFKWINQILRDFFTWFGFSYRKYKLHSKWLEQWAFSLRIHDNLKKVQIRHWCVTVRMFQCVRTLLKFQTTSHASMLADQRAISYVWTCSIYYIMYFLKVHFRFLLYNHQTTRKKTSDKNLIMSFKGVSDFQTRAELRKNLRSPVSFT